MFPTAGTLFLRSAATNLPLAFGLVAVAGGIYLLTKWQPDWERRRAFLRALAGCPESACNNPTLSAFHDASDPISKAWTMLVGESDGERSLALRKALAASL